MKVLVTGAGALLGQGIIKSLRMASAAYEIVAVDPDPRAVGLYWADRAYLVPLAASPEYMARVASIIDRERPAAVLVGTDVELMVFALHRTQLESDYGTRVIVSSPEVVRIADDKWLTNRFLIEHGYPYPQSALPGSGADWAETNGFPLVVKPRVGARSVGVRRVNNPQELAEALGRVENAIVQECVATDDREYTSGVVVTQSGEHRVITMRRDLRDGNTYRAYVQLDAPFDELLGEMARCLGALGPINFQYRLDDGVPKVFEINARFSGTTPLRAYAGFNEVDLCVRHFVLGEPIPSPDLRDITILRYWDEIILDPGQMASLSAAQPTFGPAYERMSTI